LKLDGASVPSAVKCAPPDSQPSTYASTTCSGYLASEIDSLIDLKAVLCRRQFALNAVMRMIRSKYNLTALSAKFGHGRVLRLGEGIPAIICSYHPSPRNTQTGKLTEKMYLSVMRKTLREGKIARNKP